MAKRKNTSTRSRGKSDKEFRIELITWALLVLTFAIFQILPKTGPTGVPPYFVPLSGAIILLGSGIYQYRRGWRVSPVTWIGGAIMGVFVFYNMRFDPNANFLGESLVVFAGVIIWGALGGET